MARLKVYSAPMGFYEAIVAAPNQKAALAAWGVSHDLFALGGAKVADDPEALTAAEKRPGVVLRRPLGGGPIEDANAPPGALPTPPPLARPKRGRSRPTPKRAAPPPPDRSELDAAEKALADSDAAYARSAADLDTREAEIRAERARLDREHVAEAAELRSRIDRARSAYERATRA